MHLVRDPTPKSTELCYRMLEHCGRASYVPMCSGGEVRHAVVATLGGLSCKSIVLRPRVRLVGLVVKVYTVAIPVS